MLHPLSALLRRYSFAYTAAHDVAVCRELMVEDYVLWMGEHEVRGRDTAYIPATERQFAQYPGLGFTVHELVLGEDRAALRFTEHGRSERTGGCAAWHGISLYRWDGARLTECRVEQDYHARAAQLRSGAAHAVEAPGADPWSGPASAPAAGAEDVVRRWLTGDWLASVPAGGVDDETAAGSDRVRLADPRTAVLDLFGAGERVAFHVRVDGVYAGGPLEGVAAGGRLSLFAAGVAGVAGGEVRDVRVVTDRLAAGRRARAGGAGV